MLIILNRIGNQADTTTNPPPAPMLNVVRNIWTILYAMGQKLKQNYPVAVWLSTIVSAPLLFLCAFVLYNSLFNDIFKALPFILFIGFLGALFSIPCFLLFWAISQKLALVAISIWYKKIILSLAGIISICVMFLIIDKDFSRYQDLKSFSILGAYCVALIINTLAFKMAD